MRERNDRLQDDEKMLPKCRSRNSGRGDRAVQNNDVYAKLFEISDEKCEWRYQDFFQF